MKCWNEERTLFGVDDQEDSRLVSPNNLKGQVAKFFMDRRLGYR